MRSDNTNDWTLDDDSESSLGTGAQAFALSARRVSRGGVIEPGMGGVMEPAETGVKRRFERTQECGFLPDLATAFSLLPGIGLGLRKLSPSITTR